MYCLIPLLIFLFLQGCVSVPKDQVEQSLAGPLSFENSVKAALKSTQFEQGEWPKENWWEIFHDPELSQYITTALTDSPTLQRADAKVEAARQLAKEKRSILFPDLEFAPYNNWQYLSKRGFFRAFAPVVPGNVNDIWTTLNLSWDLDLFGRNRHLYYAARGRYHAEEAERADVYLSLSAAVAKTYFELQANVERLALLKKRAERRAALLALHRARQMAGVEGALEPLARAEDLMKIERDLYAIEQAATVSDHLLRTLMGHTPDAAQHLAVLHVPIKEPIALPDNLSADLLARRPDLMAQIWRVEAAAKEIGAAKASFYPNISLTALAGTETLHYGTVFSWGSKTAALEPALHLPIFTAGRLKANLREKKAEFNEAVAAYHETLLRGAREVVDQISIALYLEKELHTQEQLVDNLGEQSQLALQRFNNGVAAYLEALQFEERFFFEEMQLIDLELKQKQAYVNLIRALGGGYHVTPPLTPRGESG